MTCSSGVFSAVSVIRTLRVLPSTWPSRTTFSISRWEVTPTCFRNLRTAMLKRSSSMGSDLLGSKLLRCAAPDHEAPRRPMGALADDLAPHDTPRRAVDQDGRDRAGLGRTRIGVRPLDAAVEAVGRTEGRLRPVGRPPPEAV